MVAAPVQLRVHQEQAQLPLEQARALREQVPRLVINGQEAGTPIRTLFITKTAPMPALLSSLHVRLGHVLHVRLGHVLHVQLPRAAVVNVLPRGLM